jgi:hypothetical protein
MNLKARIVGLAITSSLVDDVAITTRMCSRSSPRQAGYGKKAINPGTHQNLPTPQTPLNEIPRIAPTRKQPQFVKTGESGFVLFL